jgi:hypothetical protein
MADAFGRLILDRLRSVEEVEIETSAAAGAAVHRTIIWVVVDEQERVFVRSVRGPAGRWYREAVAHPACVLLVENAAIPVNAVQAIDPDSIATCSRALQVKYANDSSTPAMLREATLPTTLRLLPR